MASADRSIGSVLADIAGNFQHMVRAEMRLARAEIRDEIKKVARAAVLLVVAVLSGTLGVGVLLLAAVYALKLVLAPWAAAIVVGAATLAIGGVAAAVGVKHLSEVTLPPPKTVESVQETVQWAKSQIK